MQAKAATDGSKGEPSGDAVAGNTWIIVGGAIFVCVIILSAIIVTVMRKKKKKHGAKKASSAVELSSSVWQSHVEPQTGMTYYHNTTTGETSWQAPVELPYFVTTSFEASPNSNVLV